MFQSGWYNPLLYIVHKTYNGPFSASSFCQFIELLSSTLYIWFHTGKGATRFDLAGTLKMCDGDALRELPPHLHRRKCNWFIVVRKQSAMLIGAISRK